MGEVLAREYPGGVSLVYEGVGGALREAALANLAEGGRLLQVWAGARQGGVLGWSMCGLQGSLGVLHCKWALV